MDEKPCCAAAAERMTKKLSIEGKPLGIAHLDEIMADVRARHLQGDVEIGEALLKQVKIFNYVPSGVHPAYKIALLEEYKRRETEHPLAVQDAVSGCGCASRKTMIYTCSGGSNVGQLSNEVAKALAMSGKGKFACLAGVGAHSDSFVNNARNAQTVIVIDGCSSRCAAKTLEHAGIGPSISIVITDLGFKKDTGVLETEREDVLKVLNLIE
jgi:uncharacterized metal-binding protein